MIRRLAAVAGALASAGALAFAGLCAWGATLPAGHVASGETEIPAAPERVYARIVDPAAYPRWRSDVRGVRIVDEGRWVEQSDNGSLPFRFAAQSRPDAVETAIDSDRLPFSGTWTFELAPAPAGTRVRITERGRVTSVPMRALARFFAPPPERTLRRYLADLRASFARE